MRGDSYGRANHKIFKGKDLGHTLHMVEKETKEPLRPKETTRDTSEINYISMPRSGPKTTFKEEEKPEVVTPPPAPIRHEEYIYPSRTPEGEDYPRDYHKYVPDSLYGRPPYPKSYAHKFRFNKTFDS